MITRKLWSGTEVAALGLGCWAIGGPFFLGDVPVGWGEVDDTESVRAIHAGVEAGIRFFDSAQAYGTGHSEEVLGRALKGRPDVLIGTKVGHVIDRTTQTMTGVTLNYGEIEVSLEASLYRLKRDRIDMVHLHLGDADLDQARGLFERFERWIEAGKMGGYGWSTDDALRTAALPDLSGYRAVQLAANVFSPNAETLRATEEAGRLAVIRSPLAMGILGGRYTAGTRFDPKDIRAQAFPWLDLFKDGQIAPEVLPQFEALRGLLTSGGRSLAQGALAWLWACSPATLPIPGFKTVAQVQDLAGALEKGALSAEVMQQIERVLGRSGENAAAA